MLIEFFLWNRAWTFWGSSYEFCSVLLRQSTHVRKPSIIPRCGVSTTLRWLKRSSRRANYSVLTDRPGKIKKEVIAPHWSRKKTRGDTSTSSELCVVWWCTFKSRHLAAFIFNQFCSSAEDILISPLTPQLTETAMLQFRNLIRELLYPGTRNPSLLSERVKSASELAAYELQCFVLIQAAAASCSHNIRTTCLDIFSKQGCPVLKGCALTTDLLDR